jgi:hypothetical protein
LPVAPVYPVAPVLPELPVLPVLPVAPVLPAGPAGPAGPIPEQALRASVTNDVTIKLVYLMEIPSFGPLKNR